MEDQPQSNSHENGGEDHGRLVVRKLLAAAAFSAATAFLVNWYDQSTTPIDAARVAELSRKEDALFDRLTPDQQVIARLDVTNAEIELAGGSPEFLGKLQELDDASLELRDEQSGRRNPLLLGVSLSTGLIGLGFTLAAGRAALNNGRRYPRQDGTET